MTGKSAINLGSLPAFDAESKDLNLLIEAPKGNRNKFKYDERRGITLSQQTVCKLSGSHRHD